MLLTLCLVNQGDKLLLGMKKRGFGEGRWNGFGGKLHAGESIEDAAIREIKEEVGLEARKLKKRGILTFEFIEPPELLEIHVFHVSEYMGEPIESEEMKPQWFHVNEIPYDTMWADDIHWLPLFLAGKLFKGYFKFKDVNKMLTYKVEEVEDLTQ